MSFLKPDAAPAPAAPKLEAPPPPVLAPQGSKPKGKNQRTTFLGADSTPGGGDSGAGPASGSMGGKTLLGE